MALTTETMQGMAPMAEDAATADRTYDTSDNIAPIRVLDEAAALEWLQAQPGGRTKLAAAELVRRWGWPAQRAGRRL